jgi:oligosaccharide repeat unit polymerase
MSKIKNITIVTLFVTINLIFIYLLNRFNVSGYDFISSVISFILGSLFIFYALIKKIFNIITITGVSYYLPLAISRFRFMGFQLYFDLNALISIVLLPLFFFVGVQIINKQKQNKLVICSNSTKVKKIRIVILIIYVLTNLFIIVENGGLLIQSDNIVQDRFYYSIPFISMFEQYLMFLILSLCDSYKGKINITSIITCTLFSGVLTFSRGNIFRFLSFILMLFVLINKENIRKYYLRIVLILIVCLSFFGVLGELRNSKIIDYDQTPFKVYSIENNNLLWLYGYFATNYDIAYYNLLYKDPIYYPYSIVSPIVNTLQLKKYFFSNELLNKITPLDIYGFTSATFLIDFIVDFGYLYFIPLFFLGYILGKFYLKAHAKGFIGIMAFILMALSFSFFSNILIQSTSIGALLTAYSIQKK